MAVGLLRSLASAAPPRVFPVTGRDRQRSVDNLFAGGLLHSALSIRHANLLLVAGEIRPADIPELQRLHDQMPHPRATVWWRSSRLGGMPEGVSVGDQEEPAEALQRLHADLMREERESEADLLPDEPPNEWRGKGDHGQGGKGMMGGTPYGRPMAMTADDLRDGLSLDAYTACFGPFLPIWPPGLMLKLTLQGDVIQSASVERPPLPQQDEGVSAALQSIARLLRILDLHGPSAASLAAARKLDQGESCEPGRLKRRILWSGALQAIPPGLGCVYGEDVRQRFRRWMGEAFARKRADTPSPRQDTSLDRLLPGLEWNEAALVLNSFNTSVLRGLCASHTSAEEAA